MKSKLRRATSRRKPSRKSAPPSAKPRPGSRTARHVRPTRTKSRTVSPAKPVSPRIPPRWKWHYQALASLRDRFIRDCRERRHDASQPIEPHSMSMADSATDDIDHDIALSLLSSYQDALLEIEAAMHRIEKGTYGVCAESGKPIPAARLKAIPWARYRAEVEARHEQRNGARLPRLGKLGSVG